MSAHEIRLQDLETLVACSKRGAVIRRRFAISLLVSTSSAFATPPPPHEPPLLRKANMTATVQLVEATNGKVTNITELCRVSGKIPVYSDDGRRAFAHGWSIPGCRMNRNGQNLSVHVQGAKAVSKGRGTYAVAMVHVTPPDAKPLCPDMCGPQPLADSRAEIRVSGTPKLVAFSLNVNVVSMLNTKPVVWLKADVEIVD